MHLPPPFSLSPTLPLSALPRPCFLFLFSLIHFGASLGSIALLRVFPDLPVLLLLPRGVFILLCLLLPCSFLLFYCLVRQDAKHIQRLSDGEEEGTGSPVLVGRPSRCPFADPEEWSRGAGAGVGGALCLFGCGGLQLYGMLHALGLGGLSDGVGFRPWAWWGYQLGCRFCEVGVCLSLSIFGTHPLFFCRSNSSPRVKSNPNPRPGSWARLHCASPSGGSSQPLPPLPSSQYPWSLGQDEKLVVCDVINKPQSETLPLYTLMESPSNGLDLKTIPQPCKNQNPRNHHLPDSPSSPRGPQAVVTSRATSQASLALDTDSTVDFRPPSSIDLSRSIDQALYSETLFPHSIFTPPRLLNASSGLSLNSPDCHPSQDASGLGHSSPECPLYRTTSCGDMEKSPTFSPQPGCTHLACNNIYPPAERWWRGSSSSSLGQEYLCGSSQDLFSTTGARGTRSHSHITRGQPSQSSLPKTLTHNTWK
ncbi:hypothetical protein DPEC_G00362370 [Dallia pectoralis]|nr:hypothetical protein DPEC_G00362370 [Dallia pectoralis]